MFRKTTRPDIPTMLSPQIAQTIGTGRTSMIFQLIASSDGGKTWGAPLPMQYDADEAQEVLAELRAEDDGFAYRALRLETLVTDL